MNNWQLNASCSFVLGDVESVSRFLDDDPMWLRQNDKNPSYDRSRTAWHLAASKGQVEVSPRHLVLNP